MQVIEQTIPNVIKRYDLLFESLGETITMMLISGSISLILGLIIGSILTVCKKGGILEQSLIYNLFDKTINLFRSIPFIILMFALINFTRMIVGTAIGTRGSIIPLIFGTVPFFSRQIESALANIGPGLIEAAVACGARPIDILFKVYLRESFPGIIRGTMITFVSLVGLTAMAGVVGGGGLGDFAIRYGFVQNKYDITVVVVLIHLIMVSLIQFTGERIIKKITH